jgi:small subunit ribosomal protein S4
MEKITTGAHREKDVRGDKEKSAKQPVRKMSEYGKQLFEKQKVKHLYGMRERQFRKFFEIALRGVGAPGETLLSMLERRIDNVIYRLKMSTSRVQARQIVVHGHVFVNGRRASSPSYMVSVGDVISLDPSVMKKEHFLENVIDKRLKIGVKVPEWLELDKQARTGTIVRIPVRTDIQTPIEEHLIVELYSK